MLGNNNLMKTRIEVFFVLILIGYLVNFYGIGSIIFLSVIPLIFLYTKGHKYNKSNLLKMLFLISFCMMYSTMAYYYKFMGLNTFIIILVFPLTVYVLGNYIGSTNSNYKQSYKVLMLLSFSLSFFIILSYIKTIITYGSLDNARYVFGERSLLSIWGTDDFKATVVTAYLSFSLTSISTIFVLDKKLSKGIRKIITMLILFTSLFSLYITIQLGSRTSIILIITSIFIVFIFNYLRSFKKVISMLVYIIMSYFIYLLFRMDIFGLQTLWMQTAVYKRFESTGLESSRYEAWIKVFQGMFEYPLGGRETVFNLAYAHNLWLDIGYDVGIVPFIVLLGFSVLAFLSFLKFLILPHTIFIKTFIITYYLSFIIIFMTEPVLGTKERFYFVIFCLVVGIVDGLNQKKSNMMHRL